MKDKLINETEDFSWYETSQGLGYVIPKNTFWKFVSKEFIDQQAKLQGDAGREYAKLLMQIYSKNADISIGSKANKNNVG